MQTPDIRLPETQYEISSNSESLRIYGCRGESTLYVQSKTSKLRIANLLAGDRGLVDGHVIGIMSMVQCRFCRFALLRDLEVASLNLDQVTVRDPVGSKLV
jgi:hypothetical protein